VCPGKTCESLIYGGGHIVIARFKMRFYSIVVEQAAGAAPTLGVCTRPTLAPPPALRRRWEEHEDLVRDAAEEAADFLEGCAVPNVTVTVSRDQLTRALAAYALG
jgi:hypothetical protein